MRREERGWALSVRPVPVPPPPSVVSSRRAGMRLFHSTIKNQKQRLFLFSSVFKRILKTKPGSGGGGGGVKSNQNNGSSYTGGSQNRTQRWLNLPLVSAGVDSMAKRGAARRRRRPRQAFVCLSM